MNPHPYVAPVAPVGHYGGMGYSQPYANQTPAQQPYGFQKNYGPDNPPQGYPNGTNYQPNQYPQTVDPQIQGAIRGEKLWKGRN
jgi:hypothetical protein